MAEIVTANRLGDGIVVFLDARLRWVEPFAQAAMFADEGAKAAAMAAAKLSEARNEVVDPYWVEVVARGGGFAPKSLRESIRAHGPTIQFTFDGPTRGPERSAPEGVHVPL
jgi:Protein of unknown function (DUF2849)